MPISISMIVLGSQLVMPVADRVPKFDIARSCKLDVAATAGLSVDQPTKSCINDERKARQGKPVVKISRVKPGKLRFAREHWRHTKLRQSADMPPARSVGSLTA
jgi:hypothetical protein